jgi:uncharacterized protein (UPF0147 family)
MNSNDNDDLFAFEEDDPLKAAIFELRDISKDNLLQKNVKIKIENCLKIICDDSKDVSIRVNKVSVILDEICDDSNIESFSRTRLYNVSQLLERVC